MSKTFIRDARARDHQQNNKHIIFLLDLTISNIFVIRFDFIETTQHDSSTQFDIQVEILNSHFFFFYFVFFRIAFHWFQYFYSFSLVFLLPYKFNIISITVVVVVVFVIVVIVIRVSLAMRVYTVCVQVWPQFSNMYSTVCSLFLSLSLSQHFSLCFCFIFFSFIRSG